jgi:acyl-CoA reductase-like NAD-dependent aldehyde dehydrogenase
LILKVFHHPVSHQLTICHQLGGNDPCIVLPDVDIAHVAPKVAMGSFFNTGQVCVATKRIYVHESIYRPFLEAMVAFTSQLKVGEPGGEGFQIRGSRRESSTLGPIQNKMQFEKVKGLFENSKRNGYKFATGQDTVEESMGYYIKPAIIDNPPDDARIVTEEAFGPIVPCQSWRDETEVVARANNTKAGLAATVWGKNLKRCEKIALQMEAGSVFINSFAQPTPWAPFGGMKESGMGSEWGRSGILAYMNQKVIHQFK